MSHIGYLLHDAWEKLLALPIDFWLVSSAATFGFALFACVFWGLPGLFGPAIFNKKLLFVHFPYIWFSFEVIAVAIETNSEVFMFIGLIFLGLSVLIVKFKDEIPPR